MADASGQPTIESRTEALRPGLSLKYRKRLRLDMVVRVARRLDTLSLGCGACPGRLTSLDRMLDSLDNFNNWQLADWKAYYRSLDGVIKHLKGAHRLAEEGEHMGLWLVIGAGVGTALGAAFDGIALGVALGISGGIALGAMLDAVAHKQGRVI
jgi:hypothetical protein